MTVRGYRTAPHTIENSDFVFNVPYAKAFQDGDSALAKRLLKAYVGYTLAVTEFAEPISARVLGKEAAQALLILVNKLLEPSKRKKERPIGFIHPRSVR